MGWKPDLPAIRRGIVFDPFTGSGTTGKVALKLGRNFVGIELYAEYAEIAEERCRQAHRLRSTYEGEILSTASAEMLNETISEELNCSSDSENTGIRLHAEL